MSKIRPQLRFTLLIDLMKPSSMIEILNVPPARTHIIQKDIIFPCMRKINYIIYIIYLKYKWKH